MSVINQMLQDLENRHAASRPDQPMPEPIKVVPKRVRPSIGRALLLPLLAIGVGVSVWWLKPSPDTAHAVSASASPPVAQPQPASSAKHHSSPPSIAVSKQPRPPALQQPVSEETLSKRVAANRLVSPQLIPAPEPSRSLSEDTENSAVAQGEYDPSSPGPAPNTGSAPDAAQVPPEAVTTLPLSSEGSDAGKVTKTPEVTVSKQIKEITPRQRAENQYRAALALMQSGREIEAAAALGQTLEIDPENTAARQTLVGLLVDGKRYDEARRRLHEGLILDPSQAGLAMILARLQVEQGNTQRALATLQRNLSPAAQGPEYQSFLAALLQREGRHKEAIEHYLQALRYAPESGVWLMGLGISLQAENRHSEAREAFRRAATGHTLSPELQAFVEQQLEKPR